MTPSIDLFDQPLIVSMENILQEAVKNMFKKFVLQIKPGGCLVACGDR